MQCNILSPLDGRYKEKLTALAEVCGPAAFAAARIRAEVAWLLTLSDLWSQGYYKGMSYVRYHGGGRECRVNDDSEMKKRVCLSLGGTLATCSSCSYTSYNL